MPKQRKPTVDRPVADQPPFNPETLQGRCYLWSIEYVRKNFPGPPEPKETPE